MGTWLAAFLFIFVTALTFALVRGVRQATLWGCVWAIAQGLWFNGAWLLNLHRLRPSSVSEWAVVLVWLVGNFALIGGVLALVCSVIAVGVRPIGRRLRDETWAWCVFTWLTLPPAYIALSVALERFNFGRLPRGADYRVLLGPWIVAYLVVGAVLLWYLRQRHGARPHVTQVRLAALGASLLGCVALPYRVDFPGATSTAMPAGAIVQKPGSQTAAPLVVIALDSGNWRTLDPLIASGAAPTFARLTSEGVRGEVEALWPPFWSTPAWGAIVTGYPREDFGVYEDLAASAPGLRPFELPLQLNLALNPLFGVEFSLIKAQIIQAMPVPRTALRRPPFWELLSKAGVNTAVFRFNFSYPATGQANFVVSNRVGTDIWTMMKVPDVRTGLVSPEDRSGELLKTFGADFPVDRSLVDQFRAHRLTTVPGDMTLDPTESLGIASEIDDRTLAAATSLIRSHQDIQVAAVHIGGFDNACHAFWQYRFPEDFPDDPPAAEDVKNYGAVIDRYLQFIDKRLAVMLAAFPVPPNVIIVSDHGHGPIDTATLWRGHHASPGLFIAAGPDVPRSSETVKVSYYDIVPTILDLTGFMKADGLRGRSVVSD